MEQIKRKQKGYEKNMNANTKLEVAVEIMATKIAKAMRKKIGRTRSIKTQKLRLELR